MLPYSVYKLSRLTYLKAYPHALLSSVFRFSQPLDGLFPALPLQPCFMLLTLIGFAFQSSSLTTARLGISTQVIPSCRYRSPSTKLNTPNRCKSARLQGFKTVPLAAFFVKSLQLPLLGFLLFRVYYNLSSALKHCVNNAARPLTFLLLCFSHK